ncbi:MAG: hypothetical protein JW807_17485 [Spirochaetes bacterium]|nr:hypothetical protein [Spirochaetota bacterium]
MRSILVSSLVLLALVNSRAETGPAVDAHALKKPIIAMKNVKFRYAENIYILIEDLIGSVAPKVPGSIVNFDDINSFKIDIAYGTIFVEIPVLDAIYNTRVLNYERSRIRNMKTAIIGAGSGKKIKITGETRMGLIWTSFEITGSASLDRERNAILITAESVKNMGVEVIRLMDAISLTLEKFMPMPKGRGIAMEENTIILDPFATLKRPDSYGTITGFELVDRGLLLHIGKKMPPYRRLMPVQNARNYIFIYRGTLQWARTLTMRNGRLQMIDAYPGDYFDYYQEKYLRVLPHGSARQLSDGSIIMSMPDYHRVVSGTGPAR